MDTALRKVFTDILACQHVHIIPALDSSLMVGTRSHFSPCLPHYSQLLKDSSLFNSSFEAFKIPFRLECQCQLQHTFPELICEWLCTSQTLCLIDGASYFLALCYDWWNDAYLNSMMLIWNSKLSDNGHILYDKCIWIIVVPTLSVP